ncbi:MAG TPA: transcription-repair coupling factor [Clostridia bacterium]|nr:transcription-repair coupling factor [Clostridia bacterium]
MSFTSLLEILTDHGQFKDMARHLSRAEAKLAVFGLTDGLKPYWWSALAVSGQSQCLIITRDELSAKGIAKDLALFVPAEEILLFYGQEFVPYQVFAKGREAVSQRIRTLTKLVLEKPSFVIATPEAFCQKLMPNRVFRSALLTITRGQSLDRDELARRLVELGYERVELVEAPGQFALRGSLVDVFPPNHLKPVRVDFFDEEIDSLRYFDEENQRTIEMIAEVVISPAEETLLPAGGQEKAVTELREKWQEAVRRLQKLKKKAAIQELNQKMEQLLEQLEQGIKPENLERFQPFFYPDQETILAYFSTPPVVLLDEPQVLWDKWLHYEQERGEAFVELLETGKVLPGQEKLYAETEAIKGILARHRVVAFASLPQKLELVNPEGIVHVQAKTMHPFLGKIDLFRDDVAHWKGQHYSVVLVVGSREQGEQLKELLMEHGIEGVIKDELTTRVYPGQVVILVGHWRQGFDYPALKLAVITEKEIFGQRTSSRRSRASSQAGVKISSLTDLQEGDYVVHTQHGIGRYLGVQRLEVGGVYRDYLHIQYRGADRLYVPIDQIDLIQKYIGAEGQPPRLNKLGGSEWTRVKNRVKASVRDMAEELIKLYAARETAIGHAFSPDSPWQQEFESQFPYTETPDQLRAIDEVKRDMEKPKPMDRLLCGDVGYGKTEVALRAAFKAVSDGKQVAVLVPTTVLAQQHYHTFRERMASFPVTIGLLSRFRTPKEQAEVIRGLKNGAVDIVIGTHRLLSPDVSFKDLGLLIIDEEQRFGVAHKEKLKQLRQNIDVLTLTATPIPRTLHMALSGVRDMSIIDTPPEDRYPVQTYVVEYHPELIRNAIRRELGRGGQVYYIHNRIMDLEKVAVEVKELVPEARVALAHGQMKENELEDVMLAFVEGEYDVLVSTTIIENGLDIPNVNTLIVNNADHLGLAQLYQLRGRVGRSNRLAYAYFTFEPNKVVNQVAQKRLNAIKEFTEFGSGFKIAMRDLEIRGAGNLLGPEQHGQILAVGFEMYCRLLEEAIEAAKGIKAVEKKEEKEMAAIELAVSAYLPDDYISQSGFKMEMYRRLADARTVTEVDEVDEELFDRFGELPPPARHLLRIATLRVMATELGIKRIGQTAQEVIIEASPAFPLKGEKLILLAQAFPRKLSFSTAGGLTIKFKTGELQEEGLLEGLERLLNEMKNLASPAAG